MPQATQNKRRNFELGVHLNRALREGALFLLGAVALFMVLALITYNRGDPGWSSSHAAGQIANLGGWVGAWFADLFLYLFGVMAYLFPFMIAYSGWLLYRGRDGTHRGSPLQIALRVLGFLLTMATGTALAYLHLADSVGNLPHAGGVLGDAVGAGLVSAFSFIGATLLLFALFLTGVTLFTSFSWIGLLDVTGIYTLRLLEWLRCRFIVLGDLIQARQARRERVALAKKESQKAETRKPVRIEPVIKVQAKPGKRELAEKQVPMFQSPADEYLPALALLDEAHQSGKEVSRETLQALSRLVELKLQDFNIEVQVEEVHPGPVITRFELQLAPGIKSAQISNLAKDLARSLSTISVRIVEVIPGKTTIGLEIPNESRETVYLSEIIRSSAYEKTNAPMTLALGKDIAGDPAVVDLAKMPHLLVAGTTGSGKSVAINAMILSLLYSATPRDVRLIMIDPKMLELSVYEGIPHLLAPVVTDMKDAANALRWCVAEMERRYRLMAALGVRNIGGFNKKVKEANAAGEPLKDPIWQPLVPDAPELEEQRPGLETLPYIVVVVDELADMMMVAGKKVEELIARLAQKARASGIHLILATQRPSVDVLTGLIKANIPTRIAFQVSSRIDSRTILDQMGAEALLGHGDMLYMPPGTSLPQRVHGAFVADHEVHNVVEDLRQRGQPDYIDEIINGNANSGGEPLFPGDKGGGSEDEESDPLYDEAVRVVAETRRASVSGIQRRLKIGYNRAARMIEAMEESGIVGPLQANGSREVIVSPPPED